MPIYVVALANDQRCDQGALPANFDANELAKLFEQKLSEASFMHSDWGHLIDSEDFPKYKMNSEFHLYASRINERTRAFFITRTTSSGNNYLIIIGFMFDHQYENYFRKLDPKQQNLVSAVEAKMAELEKQEVADKSRVAEDCCARPGAKRKKLTLSALQDKILQQAERGNVLVSAPAGAGKTVLLVEWLKRELNAERKALCLVPSEALRDQIRAQILREMSETVSPELTELIDRSVFTWQDFEAMIIGSGINKTLETSKIPATFDDFKKWYESRSPKHPGAKQNSKKIKATANVSEFYLHVLYAEFTRVIFQPSSSKDNAYLSLSEYKQLGERQSNIGSGQREIVYSFFQAYMAHVYNPGTHHEPHQRMHAILHALVIAKDKTNLQIDALAVDEMQAAHAFQLSAAMALLNRHGKIFLCGDLKQDPEMQLRALDLIRKIFNYYNLEFQECLLQTNYRSTKPVLDCANQVLRVLNILFGSTERNATFTLTAAESEVAGRVSCDAFNAEFAASARVSAQCAILVPDNTHDDLLARYKTIWGANVFRISQARGLEWQQVIVVGLDENEQSALQELNQWVRKNPEKLSELSKQAEIIFNRAATVGFSAEVKIVLHLLYTAITRAKEEVYFVAEKDSFLHALVASVNLAATCEQPQPVFTASTPIEWLEQALKYMLHETTRKNAIDILWGACVWGTNENAACAKELIMRPGVVVDKSLLEKLIVQLREAKTPGVLLNSLATQSTAAMVAAVEPAKPSAKAAAAAIPAQSVPAKKPAEVVVLPDAVVPAPSPHAANDEAKLELKEKIRNALSILDSKKRLEKLQIACGNSNDFNLGGELAFDVGKIFRQQGKPDITYLWLKRATVLLAQENAVPDLLVGPRICIADLVLSQSTKDNERFREACKALKMVFQQEITKTVRWTACETAEKLICEAPGKLKDTVSAMRTAIVLSCIDYGVSLLKNKKFDDACASFCIATSVSCMRSASGATYKNLEEWRLDLKNKLCEKIEFSNCCDYECAIEYLINKAKEAACKWNSTNQKAVETTAKTIFTVIEVIMKKYSDHINKTPPSDENNKSSEITHNLKILLSDGNSNLLIREEITNLLKCYSAKAAVAADAGAVATAAGLFSRTTSPTSVCTDPLHQNKMTPEL